MLAERRANPIDRPDADMAGFSPTPEYTGVTPFRPLRRIILSTFGTTPLSRDGLGSKRFTQPDPINYQINPTQHFTNQQDPIRPDPNSMDIL